MKELSLLLRHALGFALHAYDDSAKAMCNRTPPAVYLHTAASIYADMCEDVDETHYDLVTSGDIA